MADKLHPSADICARCKQHYLKELGHICEGYEADTNKKDKRQEDPPEHTGAKAQNPVVKRKRRKVREVRKD